MTEFRGLKNLYAKFGKPMPNDWNVSVSGTDSESGEKVTLSAKKADISRETVKEIFVSAQEGCKINSNLSVKKASREISSDDAGDFAEGIASNGGVF